VRTLTATHRTRSAASVPPQGSGAMTCTGMVAELAVLVVQANRGVNFRHVDRQHMTYVGDDDD
jgi:hypothetical protein